MVKPRQGRNLIRKGYNYLSHDDVSLSHSGSATSHAAESSLSHRASTSTANRQNLANTVRKNGGIGSKNPGKFRAIGNVAKKISNIRKGKPVKVDTNMSGKKSTINHHNNATSQRTIGRHISSKSGSFRSANSHLPEPDENHFAHDSSVRDPDQISLHSTNVQHDETPTTTETANETHEGGRGGRGAKVKEVAKKIGKKIGKVAADTGANAVRDAPQYATLAAISQAGSGKSQDTSVVNNIGSSSTPYNVYS